MKVAYYGNACFSIFHNDIHIFCDPWLDAPSVAGGWMHFPPCNTKAKDIQRPDYIFISHIHSDHCEEETLNNLDKSIPIISLAREPNFLAGYLSKFNFETLTFVPEKTPTTIGPGLIVETFGATFDHVCAQFIDSSIVFDFGDMVALNCNDNAPEEDFCQYIAGHYPSIDLAFVPAGGGGAYPAMYENLSLNEKAGITKEILDNYAGVFTHALDVMKPSVVIPVAGGYVIPGPLAEKVNRLQPRHLNYMNVVQHYEKHGNSEAKIIPLNDKMIVDIDNRCVESGAYKEWSDKELDSYFSELATLEISTTIISNRVVPRLSSLIDKARGHMWSKQNEKDLKLDYTVYLDIPDQPVLYGLSLDQEKVLRVKRSDELEEPYLRMTLSQDSMLEWLLGVEDYNMLDSGHRISFFRAPNTYIQEAYFLMSFLRL